MNKKGFTLIELLAVIVILAIIALIATPIVLNIIEDSKDSSKLNSANHYIDAVEQAIMRENMSSGGNFIPSECEIQSNGNLKCDGKDIPVEVDGEKTTSGTLQFSNGKIEVIGLGYATGEYFVSSDNGPLIDGEPPKPKTYIDGDIIYYDILNKKSCEDYHDDNSISGYNGIYEGQASRKTTNNQNSCLKFYAFNDVDGNETLNLLLDHNTTEIVAWTTINIKTNVDGPIDVLTSLYNDTKDWLGAITPEDYVMDQSAQSSGAKYVVEYSKTPSIEGAEGPYKARLITAQEIAQITGADEGLNWDEAVSGKFDYYYFDGAYGTDPTWQTRPATNNYYWLYDKISGNFGYWTVTSLASGSYGAWYVISAGHIGSVGVYSNDLYGVRPVIEVLKSNLS